MHICPAASVQVQVNKIALAGSKLFFIEKPASKCKKWQFEKNHFAMPNKINYFRQVARDNKIVRRNVDETLDICMILKCPHITFWQLREKWNLPTETLRCYHWTEKGGEPDIICLLICHITRQSTTSEGFVPNILNLNLIRPLETKKQGSRHHQGVECEALTGQLT